MIIAMYDETPLKFVIRCGPVLTSQVAARFRFDIREARRVCRQMAREGLVKSERGGIGHPANECRWSVVNGGK